MGEVIKKRIPNFDYQSASRQFEDTLVRKHAQYQRDTLRDGGSQRFTLKDGQVTFLTNAFDSKEGGIEVSMDKVGHAGDVLEQLYARYSGLLTKQFFEDTPGLVDLFGNATNPSE